MVVQQMVELHYHIMVVLVKWSHSKHHFGGINEPDNYYDSSNTDIPNSRYHRPQNHTESFMTLTKERFCSINSIY